MNDSPDTFERLVLTLKSSERQEMLRQLAEVTELQEEEIRVLRAEPELSAASGTVPEKKFHEEPFVVRLWFTIFAFFSSTTPGKLYSAYLVANLGKDIARTYGRYFDLRKRSYTDHLYQELVKLKRTQVFFRSLLEAYEVDKGGFFIVLGSLLMKNTNEAIAKASDPFTVPYDEAPNKDVRASLLRDMEAAFLSAQEDERSKMYQAAQAIEWIREFCAIPFDRMILRFGFADGEGQSCLIDSIKEEMQTLVGVFSAARKVPVLLMESLYLFTKQDAMVDGKFDMEGECKKFVALAAENLASIRIVKAGVPLVDLVRYTLNDVSWQPVASEAGEDWFVLFKNAWKKRFDAKWAEWNNLHRIAMIEKSMREFLGVQQIPPLQNRPWEGLWMPLTFRHEMAILFLKGLFSVVYPAVLMKPLKILLIEGDFYRRENLVEYTDAFSVLEHQQQVIETFETRLSPKGDFGEGFMIIQAEKMATIKGKVRIENLMLSVELESDVIINRVLAAFRSIDLILGGVLGVVRGGSYETLANMASIQGKFNERYRKDLQQVRQLLQDASAILGDASLVGRAPV